MDPATARDLLTTELADLDERSRYAEQARAASTANPDSEGALGQGTGDYGTDVTTAMDSELLLDTVAEQRRGVAAALARLDAGTYGRCAVCERSIDDERLDARPEVPTCREHADTAVAV